MTVFVLFSPVSGTIAIAGKPVTGATVRRWYKGGFWRTEATETATTDAGGRFSFPEAAFRSILVGILPHEAVVTQKMTVTIKGEETVIYATVKRNYDRNGEYAGQPLDFVFDPTAKPTFFGKDPGIYVTLQL